MIYSVKINARIIMKYKSHSFYDLNIFVLLLLLTLCLSSCKSKKKEWIETSNGLRFWGLKADDNAQYSWIGDSVHGLPNGKGKLKVVTDNGEYSDVEKLTMFYGSLSMNDWKELPDGKFLGKEKKNRPEGFGVLLTDNTTLIGNFHKGKLDDGVVTILLNNQLLYHGQYEDGKYNGNGLLYNKGKKYYQGDFDDGIFNGRGKLYHEGRLLYNGEFKKGKYNGYGALYASNGSKKYIGEFKDGVYNGVGTMYSNGYVVYKGEFKDGQYNGKGTLYKAGKVITGNWTKGIYEKGVFDRAIEQTKDQYNALIGNDCTDSLNSSGSNGTDMSTVALDAFVMDSLNNAVATYVREKIEENVDNRFGITNLPRMVWQKIFTSNVDRMNYAQEAFLKDLSAADISNMVNGKIRNYNETSNSSYALHKITMSKIKQYQIVDEKVFHEIQTRETMEFTDLFTGVLLDAIMFGVAGLIVGLIGLIWGNIEIPKLGGILGFIAGLIFGIIVIGKTESNLESKITNMVTENYMNYINTQDITTKALTR